MHKAMTVARGCSTGVKAFALYVVCGGVLMTVLDATIVAVALPSISEKFDLGPSSSAWLVNSYVLSYGGLLVLSGRLCDLYSARDMFLFGLAVFTLASLVCGLATSYPMLLGARALQGVGGAVVASVSLALVVNLSSDAVERAKALGVYGLVCACAGGLGEVLGGFVTSALGWRGIFLVNIPIGMMVFTGCILALPRGFASQVGRRLDIAGACLITSASALAVYCLVNGPIFGWDSTKSLALMGVDLSLFLCFLIIQASAREPLIPLRFLHLRNFTTASFISALWSAGTFAWFVMAALYLQRVLGYDALHVGLSFVPADVLVAGISAGPAAKMVSRFGVRPLWLGFLLIAAGLASFAYSRVDGSYMFDVLPGMSLLGLGGGMVSGPLLVAVMSEIEPPDSGAASGVFNTVSTLGGAFGLAALTALATSRSIGMPGVGAAGFASLNAGYHHAFAAAASINVLAAILSAFVLRLPSSKLPSANVLRTTK